MIGRVQQAILDKLATDPGRDMSLNELCVVAHKGRTEHALGSLWAKGLVDKGTMPSTWRIHGAEREAVADFKGEP